MCKYFIFVLIFLTISLLITGESKAENNNTTMLAPDFTLKDTENATFNLSDYESKKTVILLFMYVFCEPCEEFVNEVLDPYSNGKDNESVAIISISVYGEDNETGLREYAEEHNWRHALGDSDGDVEIAYNVTAVPKIFIIDKNRMITFSQLGYYNISLDEFESQVHNATFTAVDEKLDYCPDEITDENEDIVEESCLATFDEPAKSKDDEDKGFLPSLSFFVSICAVAIIAFRRR